MIFCWFWRLKQIHSKIRVFFFFFLGCITAEELKFVLTHLPGKVTYKEIDEMIKTVDENGDGKINYQEFRYINNSKNILFCVRNWIEKQNIEI